MNIRDKITSAHEFIEWKRDFEPLKNVVFTNGCFDILHAGHVLGLEWLVTNFNHKEHLYVLGVNTDQSIRSIKGNGRPVNTLADRLTVLSGLWCVQRMIPFAEDTASTLVSIIKPDIIAKGEDYRNKPWPEAEIVKAFGGQAVYIPSFVSPSTTDLAERIARL